ncbi:tRNA lysidine(34) synthetase TilS [Rhizobium sp. C4]|uniref:tRNA lysidine(34) synthetase TilS n=1 Tax=Rhizobium sp. C4 TaxID=1349800 RepID=UPI001E3B572F|nr:tRNA lysidine(34) synthetase TilS [Rhizobium sp. C4]MCD2174166.1 tRNA lysidine(34) synthetase TilS [Rhizobium sp. C4]
MPGGLTAFSTLSPPEAGKRYLEGQPDGTTVAVALSGGGDSVGLLSALCDAPCFRAGRVRLAAITVDHGLRPESAGEAAAMGDLCRALSIPHLVMSWQGEKPPTGLSEAARQARYRLLAEGADRLGANCVATAHTLDDQLETVEMRRQRSDTSPRGLAGIAPAALFFGRLAVHRPFLPVRRAEIRAYLAERKIRWFDDPSNDNPRYERVRVRQAGQFALDGEAIAIAARRRMELAKAAAEYTDAHARMPLPLLFALDRPQDDEAGRLALATLIAIAGGQTHLPGEEQLDRLRQVLETGASSVSLGRTVVERRKDVLFIGRDQRNLPPLQIPQSGSVEWDGRFRFAHDADPTMATQSHDWSGEDKDVPPRIARRARATLPDLSGIGGGELTISVTPHLALFETVLPSFDKPLADAVCRLSARPLFPCFLSAGLATFPLNG